MTIKTWAFAYNTTPTDQSSALQQARSFCRQFILFLVANGWTVTQSSDSTQSGAANYWDALSKLVWSAGAHSWIVLKSPAGIVAGADGTGTGEQSRLWISLDLDQANNYQFTVRFHRMEPSGGTTSAAPTSTNQLSKSPSAFIQFLKSSFIPTAIFHFLACSTGEFIAMAGYSGYGVVPFAMGILPVTGIAQKLWTATPYPYAAIPFQVFNDGGTGALNTASLSSAFGWNEDGTAISGSNLALTIYAQQSNAIGYSLPSTGDAFTGTHLSQPFHAINITTNKSAYIGKIADMEASGQSTPQGSVNSDATPTAVFIGNLWLPTNSPVQL